jgi:hypothetical protein
MRSSANARRGPVAQWIMQGSTEIEIGGSVSTSVVIDNILDSVGVLSYPQIILSFQVPV